MIRLVTVMSILFGTAAMAQDLPATFNVKGVAANDVLNIRAEPNAQAQVLEELAPNTKGIEIIALSDDEKWGQTQAGEAGGWVAMRFLEAAPIKAGNKIPRPVQCYGVEPSWSIKLTEGGAEWSTTEEREVALTVSQDIRGQGGSYVEAKDPAGRDFRLMVQPASCNDTMSDRPYGFEAKLFVTNRNGSQMYSGCCTLSSR